jgi:xanthine dehydrogenase accessory factor
VALVTDLESGQQSILEADNLHGDLKLSAEDLAAANAALASDRSGTIADGKIFVQVFNPPLRMIVVGAVHIAQHLVPMAALTGYDVTVVDPRRAWATDSRFPDVKLLTEWPDDALRGLAPDRRTAVVVLTHDPKLDDPALAVALASPAFYVGALGSTRTHDKRKARLRESGLEDDATARIHAPIGLAIGAKSPAEIAISILAQVTQVQHGAPALVKAG